MVKYIGSSSEGEGSLNAHVNLGVLVGSLEGDGVVSSWGIGWHEPLDGFLEHSWEGLLDLNVLVVQLGGVPVDVHVDVLNVHWDLDGTSEVQGDVGSELDWVWAV